MTIEIVIDTRERELAEQLQRTTEITIEQLDLGDIVFRRGNEIILIIERKTINDLKASICDGRGREQKARLLGNFPKNRIMYLIEGNLNKQLDAKIGGMPVSTLIGSLINTQLRDGIKVYKTSGIDESIEFIRKLQEKLESDGAKYFKDDDQTVSAGAYSSTLKKKKKANMTTEVWFISQLSLLPQVTEVVAVEVVKIYPNICKLIQTYERTPEHLREKLIADITFPIKNGKTRRVGDKISSRVYKFCYGLGDEIGDEKE